MGPRACPWGSILLLGFLIFPFEAHASVAGEVKKGNEFYKTGAYGKAAEKYEKALERRSESDIINFDLGTAYYKKKEYPNAIEHLQKSLLTDDTSLKLKGQYNLGNALFHFGLGQEKENLDQAISSLEQSLAAYENVIKVDVKDTDAKYNAQIVKKELERLKKQKEQQASPSPNPKKGTSQDQKDSKSQQEQPENQGKPDQQKSSDASQKQHNEEKNQSLPQNAEEKKAGEEQKESQDQKQGQPSDGPPSGQPDFDKSSGAASAADKEPLEKREAEMLLRDYQQREEPKGLLNFQKRSSEETPVTKDW